MKIRPFQIERYFAKYEFNVKYLLSPSDCEALTVRELLDMASAPSLKLWNELGLQYTESMGHPVLRQRIAEMYQKTGPECITILTPEEGIFLAVNAILEEGDHAVCIAPAYQSLYEVADSIGCRITPWTIEEDGNAWKLDMKKLRDSITEKTKAIIVNFPHNPTGYQPSADEQKEIISIAGERGLYLFWDEMYRGLELAPDRILPAACDCYDKAVSLSGLSKTYGLPGLRIGWLASRDRDFISRIASLKDYTSICQCAPGEILGIIALENAHRIAARNLEIVKGNLVKARDFFGRHEDIFTWFEPLAGSIAYPRLDLDEDIFRFAEEAVKEENVMIIPSTVFDQKNGHFRIGLGRRNFPECLDAFGRYVGRLR